MTPEEEIEVRELVRDIWSIDNPDAKIFWLEAIGWDTAWVLYEWKRLPKPLQNDVVHTPLKILMELREKLQTQAAKDKHAPHTPTEEKWIRKKTRILLSKSGMNLFGVDP